MRLFVGLPLPADAVRVLDTAVAPLRERWDDLSWTRPEGWHLTLAFLGHVDDDQVAPVTDAVHRGVAGSGPLELSLGPPGRFGTQVLWVGVDDRPSGGVVTLGASVQAAIEAADLPVQRRAVHAHVTLARARRGRGGRRVGDAEVAALEVPATRWTADAVALFVSERGGRGPARYPVAASFPLSRSS